MIWIKQSYKYAKVFNRCIFSVAKTAWRKLTKRKLQVPRKSTYGMKHVDETVCMNIQSMDHNYIRRWQAYNLPHFLKLIGSQKQVARTPTTTRAQTSERDMSVVFLCVLCCLLAVQTVSSPGVCLYPGGITWKLNGSFLTWPSLHNMDLKYGAWI